MPFGRVEPAEGGASDVPAVRACVEERDRASQEVSELQVQGLGSAAQSRALSEMRPRLEDEIV